MRDAITRAFWVVVAVLAWCSIAAAQISLGNNAIPIPVPTTQGGTGTNNLPDDLSVAITRPLVELSTGQSNDIGVGEGGDTTVDHTCGDILVWDDIQLKLVSAVYGVYPLTSQAPGQSTYSPNPGIEILKQIRASGKIQCGRPLEMFMIAKGGKSISNWEVAKLDLNSVLTLPTAMTLAQTALTAAGSPKVDFIYYNQGQEDSIGNEADIYSGNAFAAWGFGNTATGLVANAYMPSSVVTAVTNAGGFNTHDGYQAALVQAVTNLRSLPGMSPTTPVLLNELSDFWQSGEFSRDDVLRNAPTSINNTFVVSAGGLAGSAVATNVNHFSGTSLNQIGVRGAAAFFAAYPNAQAIPPVGPTGNPVGAGQILKITNNIDDSGNGISQSPGGDLYQIAADQLRGGLQIYAYNSSIYLPAASSVPGLVNLDYQCWSGTCYILTLQTLVNYPGAPTSGSYNLAAGATTLNSYSMPAGARLHFSNGGSRWTLLSNAYNQGLLRGNLFGSSANIGTNGAAMFLSSALVTGNVFTLSYTLSGVTSTVSATFDGTTNTTSDATIAALAAALQSALGATYTVDAIASANAMTVMGPAQVTFNAGSSTITSGASQPTIGALTGAYAISSRMIGEAWGAAANVTYILPPSNANNPGDVELIANGGGSTAGPIWIDGWDLIFDRYAIGAVAGGWGTNPYIRVEANQSIVMAPDLTARWIEKGGTYLAPLAGLAQGGQLNVNPFRMVFSGALITGNSTQCSGTATPPAGGPTAITTVTQPFIQSSGITLGLLAQQLQTSLAAVVTGATAKVVYGQNILQIDSPATASFALTCTVTGGASQATAAQDSGIYSMSPWQMGRDWYVLAAGETINLPSPNASLVQRVGLNAQTATSPSTVGTAGGLLTTRGGLTSSTLTLRPGMTSVFEASQSSRWQATGGTFLNWSESTLLASPSSGVTVNLVSGAQHLKVRVTGPTVASLPIALPSSPVDGDTVVVETESALTSVTWSNGTTVNAPSAMAVNSWAGLEYMTNGGKWLRVQ